jgi:hypothetical protein
VIANRRYGEGDRRRPASYPASQLRRHLGNAAAAFMFRMVPLWVAGILSFERPTPDSAVRLMKTTLPLAM